MDAMDASFSWFFQQPPIINVLTILNHWDLEQNKPAAAKALLEARQLFLTADQQKLDHEDRSRQRAEPAIGRPSQINIFLGCVKALASSVSAGGYPAIRLFEEDFEADPKLPLDTWRYIKSLQASDQMATQHVTRSHAATERNCEANDSNLFVTRHGKSQDHSGTRRSTRNPMNDSSRTSKAAPSATKSSNPVNVRGLDTAEPISSGPLVTPFSDLSCRERMAWLRQMDQQSVKHVRHRTNQLLRFAALIPKGFPPSLLVQQESARPVQSPAKGTATECTNASSQCIPASARLDSSSRGTSPCETKFKTLPRSQIATLNQDRPEPHDPSDSSSSESDVNMSYHDIHSQGHQPKGINRVPDSHVIASDDSDVYMESDSSASMISVRISQGGGADAVFSEGWRGYSPMQGASQPEPASDAFTDNATMSIHSSQPGENLTRPIFRSGSQKGTNLAMTRHWRRQQHTSKSDLESTSGSDIDSGSDCA
ncbi:hypothetical protein C8R43DRAFT_952790 [Mycena crocata]|nr:hypothetical protein C8R43DRAFT_952790 [Mycena crocata]